MYGEDFRSRKQVNEWFKNGLKMGVKALSEQENLRPVKYKTDKNIKLVRFAEDESCRTTIWEQADDYNFRIG